MLLEWCHAVSSSFARSRWKASSTTLVWHTPWYMAFAKRATPSSTCQLASCM